MKAILTILIATFTFAVQAIDVEKMADAIFVSEGGFKTSHPYGIMVKYKTTTPRQACINTIRHAMRDAPDATRKDVTLFIPFLADRYCPPSVDPVGNRNWKKNVSYFYNKNIAPKS